MPVRLNAEVPPGVVLGGLDAALVVEGHHVLEDVEQDGRVPALQFVLQRTSEQFRKHESENAGVKKPAAAKVG